MMSNFDRHIINVPAEWNTALVEVVDTAHAIRLILKDWNIDSPELLLGLTELALKRHDNLK